MKDWKGNTVDIGSTIIIVDIKTPFGGDRVVFPVADENGDIHLIDGGKTSNNYHWNINVKYIVTDFGNSYKTSFTDAAGSIPINLIEMMIKVQPWQILCIEGKSDNKDEYFEHLFSL